MLTHVHKWQKPVHHHPPPLQEKQGPYFLWLQAGFRSLCPLIYQRTAVLRLCDDQSPLPSVSLTQSLLSPSSALSFPCNLLLSLFLCFSTSLIPSIPSEHFVFPHFCPNHLAPLCSQFILSTHEALGFIVFLLAYIQTEKYLQQFLL